MTKPNIQKYILRHKEGGFLVKTNIFTISDSTKHTYTVRDDIESALQLTSEQIVSFFENLRSAREISIDEWQIWSTRRMLDRDWSTRRMLDREHSIQSLVGTKLINNDDLSKLINLVVDIQSLSNNILNKYNILNK